MSSFEYCKVRAKTSRPTRAGRRVFSVGFSLTCCHLSTSKFVFGGYQNSLEMSNVNSLDAKLKYIEYIIPTLTWHTHFCRCHQSAQRLRASDSFLLPLAALPEHLFGSAKSLTCKRSQLQKYQVEMILQPVRTLHAVKRGALR